MKFDNPGEVQNFEEGDVVICGTSQAGTLIQIAQDKAWVLLANLDIWYGDAKQCKYPQDQAHLDACPREVDRFKGR